MHDHKEKPLYRFIKRLNNIEKRIKSMIQGKNG